MNKISARAIFRGAFGLAAAIILGAIAAHELEDRLPEYNLKIYETAVKYQFYGCFGLILLGMLNHLNTLNLKWPITLLRFGILIFSGTLYFLALRPLMGIEGYNWFGAITPIGGLSMISAWIWTGTLYFKVSVKSI